MGRIQHGHFARTTQSILRHAQANEGSNLRSTSEDCSIGIDHCGFDTFEAFTTCAEFVIDQYRRRFSDRVRRFPPIAISQAKGSCASVKLWIF